MPLPLIDLCSSRTSAVVRLGLNALLLGGALAACSADRDAPASPVGASGGAGGASNLTVGAAATGSGGTEGNRAGGAGASGADGLGTSSAGTENGGVGGALGSGTSGGSGPSSAGQGGATAAMGGMAGASTSAGTLGSGGSRSSGPLTIHIAGDSTVQNYTDTASKSDQAGWGQMLGALFESTVKIQNRAIGGRTARRFIEEGRLEGILEDIQPGDYLLVQFGTNDGNRTATYEREGQTIPYYLDPATDFRTYLRQYLDGARSKQATPVLVTPPPRNSAYCTGGNGTGAHAQAMRELGTSEDVFVVDLNQKTVAHLKAICPAPTPEDFFFVRADDSVDGTHFQENGARIMAGFVARELERLRVPVAQYLR